MIQSRTINFRADKILIEHTFFVLLQALHLYFTPLFAHVHVQFKVGLIIIFVKSIEHKSKQFLPRYTQKDGGWETFAKLQWYYEVNEFSIWFATFIVFINWLRKIKDKKRINMFSWFFCGFLCVFFFFFFFFALCISFYFIAMKRLECKDITLNLLLIHSSSPSKKNPTSVFRSTPTWIPHMQTYSLAHRRPQIHT